MLRHLFRFLTPIAVFVFGIIPSFFLFFWLERNMALPGIGPWMAQNLGAYGSWPLLFLDMGLAGWIAFNTLLIAVFGFAHSGLAAVKTPRPLYIIATGFTSLLILTLWQPTGIVLYQFIRSAEWSATISLLIFWPCTIAAGYVITRIEGPFSFVGLKSRPPESEIPFHAEGLYARVRHPGYSFTLLAWFATPMLSLDRLVFGIAMGAYLLIGIRLEERRLIARFGDAYRTYQKQVPMLIPRIGRRD